MHNLKMLYIKNNQQITELETQNYLLDQHNEIVQNFAKVYFELSHEEIQSIQEQMTQKHCEHEMNFQVKDENGMYNKVVATPFHGFAPIPKKYVDDLALSTRDILALTRKLLQNLLSNKDISVKSLKLEHIPSHIAQELISIIKNNIYYEPEISHPALKDYPFLCIVGFDSAVCNLQSSEHSFFEFNAGTPCGIEDQYQLFEHFKNIAPKLAKEILPYIPQDQSHQFLKETIDECAKFWTQGKKGISVILGPGTYNPGHPEIAALSVRSGMPLVKIQDLYIDHAGDVRLKTIDKDHPIVTGIYNRKEESFLLYSEKFRIPLRSPFTSQNKELSKKFNVELKEGILYSYFYDNNFNITGVDIDAETNQAKYQILFEQISEDPKTGHQGDLIQAIWNRKLFVSNLGGRIFDDKRAFRIIHEYFANKDTNVAHPPAKIKLEDLEKNFSKAVIKAPDLSGGAGVIIGAQLGKEEKKIELKKIHEKPQYYEIQEMAKLAVINTYDRKQNKIIPLPIDWRLIISFGPDEIPRVSTHSCLVRSAPFGSLKTNTSSGGGYALGLMYELNGQVQEIRPTPNHKALLTETRSKDIQTFLTSMKQLLELQDKKLCETIIYNLRDIMDLIGLENIVWINNLRKFQRDEISLKKLEESYSAFLRTSKIESLT